MALITRKMQVQMMDFQSAVATRGADVHQYVSISFSAVTYLIAEGHLATRKMVEDHITMVIATATAFIDNRQYRVTPKKGK